jgi:hypothetical protein
MIIRAFDLKASIAMFTAKWPPPGKSDKLRRVFPYLAISATTWRRLSYLVDCTLPLSVLTNSYGSRRLNPISHVIAGFVYTQKRIKEIRRRLERKQQKDTLSAGWIGELLKALKAAQQKLDKYTDKATDMMQLYAVTALLHPPTINAVDKRFSGWSNLGIEGDDVSQLAKRYFRETYIQYRGMRLLNQDEETHYPFTSSRNFTERLLSSPSKRGRALETSNGSETDQINAQIDYELDIFYSQSKLLEHYVLDFR